MKRRLLLCLAMGLLAAPVMAQPLDSASITGGGSDCSVSIRCLTILLPTQTISTAVAITGTFSATLQFEGSADGGVTWFSVLAIKMSDGSSATSTTATGLWSIANGGLTHVRVRCSAYTSGTANVTAVRGYATAKWLTPFVTALYTGDGSVAAPSIARSAGTSTGLFFNGNDLVYTSSGARSINFSTTGIGIPAAASFSWSSSSDVFASADLFIGRDAANTLFQRNGSNAQTFRIGPSTGYLTLTSNALLTQGSATGLTINDAGNLRSQVYKVTLDKTAFVCAATTCDVTIATLPANTWLLNVTASLTQTFACTATCTTSTLSAVLGKGSGGSEYLASADMDAATAIFGDADAEMGTLLTRAAAIQGGTFTSSSQAVVFRLVSGTGNIGTGAATNLSQGSITIWLTTRVLP